MSQVFGLQFTNYSQMDVVRTLTAAPIQPGHGARSICTANLDHIVQLRRSADFREAYDHAWIVTADGAPVYWYAKIRGAREISRVTGSDLFWVLLPALPVQWARCFFVASTPATAQALISYLLSRGFARDAIAYYIPKPGFEHDEQYCLQLAKRIRDHRATHLFLGVGSPKSEIWIHRQRKLIGNCYALSSGAGLDFFAGTQRRAPLWMQSVGLEWLYRVLQEPRRLCRRYFVDSWGFIGAVAQDISSGGEIPLKR